MKNTPQAKSFAKAYTIIESLVVLAILAVLTMVLIALYIHEIAPSQDKDRASTSLSDSEDNGTT
ncbi:MAG: type II secretion system protein [Luteolibacter sp.]